MINHTPAPWKFAPKLTASENHRGYGIYSARGFEIALAQPCDIRGIEGLANARIMSASPILLEELKNALYVMDIKLHPSVVDIYCPHIREAIAKAEGKQ
jgi:hypothetical protein